MTVVSGYQEQNSGASAFHATQFLIKMMLMRVSVATLVQVQAVTNSGGLEPVGFVDILPLVNMLDGQDVATPHDTVFHRSEERRVGKECRIGCRSRWSPYH